MNPENMGEENMGSHFTLSQISTFHCQQKELGRIGGQRQ